jgi:hypothetical protein
MENNARSLADHWSWVADRGLMNRNTAAGLRSACTRVLEVYKQRFRKTLAFYMEYLQNPGGGGSPTPGKASSFTTP